MAATTVATPPVAAPVAAPPLPAPPAAVARRRRWPWVVLALLLVAALAGGGFVALIGGSAQSPAVAPTTTTSTIGQTYTASSGVAFAVTAPKPYQPSNPLLLQQGNVAYETTLTVTNGSRATVTASSITVTATVAGQPVSQVFDSAFLGTQAVLAGQQLAVPFRFQAPSGAHGPVAITLREGVGDAVTFGGTV